MAVNWIGGKKHVAIRSRRSAEGRQASRESPIRSGLGSKPRLSTPARGRTLIQALGSPIVCFPDRTSKSEQSSSDRAARHALLARSDWSSLQVSVTLRQSHKLGAGKSSHAARHAALPSGVRTEEVSSPASTSDEGRPAPDRQEEDQRGEEGRWLLHGQGADAGGSQPLFLHGSLAIHVPSSDGEAKGRSQTVALVTDLDDGDDGGTSSDESSDSEGMVVGSEGSAIEISYSGPISPIRAAQGPTQQSQASSTPVRPSQPPPTLFGIRSISRSTGDGQLVSDVPASARGTSTALDGQESDETMQLQRLVREYEASYFQLAESLFPGLTSRRRPSP